MSVEVVLKASYEVEDDIGVLRHHNEETPRIGSVADDPIDRSCLSKYHALKG